MSERIWIDCEFDGFGGELISMALVSEDGREWYGVMPNKGAGMYEPWVYANVMPHLMRSEASMNAMDRQEFNFGVQVFLSQFSMPTIIADWYTDLKHLLDCFQGRDHSESFNYSCNMVLDMSLSSEASEVPHNALYDARAIAATARR